MSKRDRMKEKRQRNRHKRQRADRRYIEYIRFVRQGLQMGELLTDELLEQRNKEWALLREAQAQPCPVCGDETVPVGRIAGDWQLMPKGAFSGKPYWSLNEPHN